MVNLSKMIAGLSLGIALGCGSAPKSVLMKGDYPALTAEVLASLEDRVLANVESEAKVVMNASKYPGEEVIEFEGLPKEYINYFVGSSSEDYKAKGIEMPGLDNLRIAIVPKREIGELCYNGDACYSPEEDMIIMPDNYGILQFFDVFNHEFGHHISPGALEYSSVSNQSYGAVKTYGFSDVIGSLALASAFIYGPIGTKNESRPFLKMYLNGSLFSVLNLLDYRGDIDFAMESLVNSKALEIDTRLSGMLKEYGDMNFEEVYFTAWDRLLDGSPFIDIRKKHNAAKLGEVLSYLRLKNYEMALPPGLKEGYRAMLEESDFDNPYFRAESVSALTWLLSLDLKSAVEVSQYSDEVHDLSKRIIDVNSSYPCFVSNPYECPKYIRGMREDHLKGYYYLVTGAERSAEELRKLEAVSYAKDFIARFLPDADFNACNFDAVSSYDGVASNYLAAIAVSAGRIALYRGELDDAKKFFKAVLAVNCNDKGMVGNNACKDYKSQASMMLGDLER